MFANCTLIHVLCDMMKVVHASHLVLQTFSWKKHRRLCLLPQWELSCEQQYLELTRFTAKCRAMFVSFWHRKAWISTSTLPDQGHLEARTVTSLKCNNITKHYQVAEEKSEKSINWFRKQTSG